MKIDRVSLIIAAALLLLVIAGCGKNDMGDNDTISEREFCSCVSLEQIDRTIPVVNQYLRSLGKNSDDEQRFQALAGWFKSFPCIIDARIISYETISEGYPPKREVAFSFMEEGIARELILGFSTINKVLSYHYDIINGVYVKTKKDFTIDKVFDFINSLDIDVNYIYDVTYISSMPSENLQYILDNLNAKPYTSEGNMWRVSGYLHYLTNQIHISPRLYDIKNKDYQADWLKSMDDYQLVEDMRYDFSGHSIVFQIQEDPENKGTPNFEEYDFVEWAEFSYNRYMIFDKSL